MPCIMILACFTMILVSSLACVTSVWNLMVGTSICYKTKEKNMNPLSTKKAGNNI